jgi:hypothetical protein
VATTVWHGDDKEASDLNEALERNCTCEYDEAGARKKTCQPHAMLTGDQRALDGLVFMRREADRLRRGEFSASRRQRKD